MERGAHPPQGIGAGSLVAAGGAVALLVGLFLDWYSPGGPFVGEGASAWTVFEIVDLLLALLGIVVLVAVLDEVVSIPRLPAWPTWSIPAAGVVALLLVSVSLVNDPPAAVGASLEAGIWISFAGAILMTLGGLLGRTRIALVITPRDDSTQVLDVEKRP